MGITALQIFSSLSPSQLSITDINGMGAKSPSRSGFMRQDWNLGTHVTHSRQIL